MDSLPREVGRSAGTITSKGYGMMQAFQIMRSIIDSLQQEQSKVDLEKEYTEFVVSDPVYSKLINNIVGKSIARHFYELGLNARKEEKL